jgi:polysaccharide pyruvyl transferase WcaK-like protein
MNGPRVFTASWGQLEGKHSNMGDLIIFEAIIRMLRSMPRVKEIYCYSSDVEYTNRRYEVSSQNPFSVKGLLRTINNIKKSDIVLLGGGELVQTKSSFLYLVANLAPGLLSILFKKKCLAIGAGIGDSKEISRVGKIFARFVLNRIEKVCVRDRVSFRNGLAMGLKKDKISLSADLALQLSETNGIGATRQGDKVMFCPRFTEARKGGMLPALMMMRFNKGGYWREFNESAGRFAELLKGIAGEFDVILLPCYSGSGGGGKDRAFSERILELAGCPSNVEVYDGPVDFYGIRDLINQTFVTVGVPVHALILTSIMNNPSIAISYASKCSSFMEEMGLESYILDISGSSGELSVQRIIGLIKGCRLKQREISSAIRKRVEELAQRNTENYDAILKCLPTADIV